MQFKQTTTSNEIFAFTVNILWIWLVMYHISFQTLLKIHGNFHWLALRQNQHLKITVSLRRPDPPRAIIINNNRKSVINQSCHAPYYLQASSKYKHQPSSFNSRHSGYTECTSFTLTDAAWSAGFGFWFCQNVADVTLDLLWWLVLRSPVRVATQSQELSRQIFPALNPWRP